MKKIILVCLLAGIAGCMAATQVPATTTPQAYIPVIKVTRYNVAISKFTEGHATCYVAESLRQGSGSHNLPVAISCIPGAY